MNAEPATTPRVRLYRAVAYVNVTPGPDHWAGWVSGHALAEVQPESGPETWTVWASTRAEAVEKMFTVGNRMAPDAAGREWPSDVRSLSVGDVVTLIPRGPGLHTFACERMGWRELTPAELAASPVVALADTEATSRTT